MFESVSSDPKLVRNAYERRLLREKTRRAVTTQRRVPYSAFVITTSATPDEAREIVTELPRPRFTVVDISIHASAAGSNVYVKIRRPAAWRTIVMLLPYAAAAALLASALWHPLILPGLIASSAAAAEIAGRNFTALRVRGWLTAALPERRHVAGE